MSVFLDFLSRELHNDDVGSVVPFRLALSVLLKMTWSFSSKHYTSISTADCNYFNYKYNTLFCEKLQ